MDDNKFPFGVVKGGKGDEDSEALPEDNYAILDMDDNEFFGTGFLVFTPYHVAIMRDKGKGAVPVLLLPLNRVKIAEVVDEEDLEIL
jgi:hypothetical protein